MKGVWFVLFLFLTLPVFSQHSARVKELEKQRKEALVEIEEADRLLKETTRTAKNSLNRLNLLSSQLLNRKKVLSLLTQEVVAISNQVESMKREIQVLEKELNNKKGSYSKSLEKLYKHRNSQDKLLFILSADNFSQSIRRMRYLREYGNWQKKQAYEIIDKQKEIESKRNDLEKTREEKQALVLLREQERDKLQQEEKTQKVEVQQLNRKQKELQAALRKKKQQAALLNRQIEKLIAEEVARAEEEAKKAELERKAREQDAVKGGKTTPPAKSTEKRVAEIKGGYAMTQEEKKLSDNFAENKGRLPAPLNKRYTIVAYFGEQQHQELKNIRTNNNGIDLRTSPGADAQVVFNGVVTRVFVVPGYNNSVIVRHGNYLTVYSNLSQVYVKQGDKVNTRQLLGRIYSDPEDGNTTILHFQLWKERTKLNPAPWISR
ncbi:MAG: peptidoglycan DD-metalloendopeptidase family protein [Massilibacteroides sp.]|nr:peptidoglycan DD-metalloendopeptidase family protein [Massilibacteroides sp.]MDD3062056.1 peptidoglycan DD-metalloendopeptidase family protein [Massilibacteroides sp.]MDD4116160.1 peptidoglycan DD-metalloendopeptidase family protein [Massilibacteroides sp.]MDD4659600.1 peptidoglycan DD-metalloendopeptidase family protein [Massilibacteroides sp.]